jgi:hypothetical protein
MMFYYILKLILTPKIHKFFLPALLSQSFIPGLKIWPKAAGSIKLAGRRPSSRSASGSMAQFTEIYLNLSKNKFTHLTGGPLLLKK